MTQYIEIHPENPQPRLINQAVALLRSGGLIVYPTDSGYAFGCELGNKDALERIRRIRELDKSHNFTLICRDLSELSSYAKVDNAVYRVLRNFTPGPYTFILKATHEVPRRLQHPKKKTIGIRVPNNNICMALLDALGEPLMSSSLLLPEEDHSGADPEFIHASLEGRVDLVINGGICGNQPTTVVDLTEGEPELLRAGAGEPSHFVQ